MTPLTPEIRDFYTRPVAMTDAGPHAAALESLAADLGGLCEVVQGVLLHFHWAQAYGVALAPERAAQQHLRTTAATLDSVLAISAEPLTTRREARDRAVGVCRHFSLLSAAMLRAHGIAARCRVGFATYFTPGEFVDHWVVEYWDAAQGRWRLVDAQLDALQKAALKPDFDPLDVPRDRFVIAGDAWRRCRAGEADPMRFGIMDMHGLWFVGGNVLRDFAALNNMEMLPWDCWGRAPESETVLSPQTLALFDRLAMLSLDADARFGEIRAMYESDPELRVPAQVFNAVLNRVETV
ncbi:MAG TPA: transglutaminase-like domain-containing protein [Caulobacteraceae bacterium]|nr:transglutaminase-like domain-containing protein [Caulobacteraceae bacterium]